MKNRRKTVSNIIVIFACLLVMMSFFLPWAQILLVTFSAFDFVRGALSGGNTSLIQKGMAIFFILPLISLIQLLTESLKKTINHWIPYFVNGLIILAASFYYGSIEIGPFVSVTGAILLCAISLKMRKENIVYKV